MEVIVLAGGLGTRLKKIVQDIPKPMAPINGKPFLWYIFEYLWRQGVRRVILSAGYKHEIIEEYFEKNYKDISIIYSIEDEPLGTGGAIKKAVLNVEEKDVIILNGDTFFNIDIRSFVEQHSKMQADFSLALKPMKNFDRYGSVEVVGERIINFNEKKYKKYGYINGGIYITNPCLFNDLDLPDKFSIENDFFPNQLQRLKFGSYISNTYFIDIGIPEDYEKAKRELGRHI
ncbi:MAG: nucleotidyltransferase family protein [Deltaproteobacteria bacterium]